MRKIMFFYTRMIQLAWSIFVMELTTIEGHTESIQRKLYEPPLRRGLRSVLIHAHVGDTATNSFPSAEMDSYQGLVGRPGIDFPVLTHIPNTVFDCKNHGNGYFADLETRCQVFHICDDGKKISFLCPNGTIFRQLDLICDWWFKVDCASTPNHFAESTEMLTQAKRARLQSKHPVPQPINHSDESLTVSIQNKRLLLGNTANLEQQSLSKNYVPKVLEFNRRNNKSNSADTAVSDGLKNQRNVNTNDNIDRLSNAADEIQDTAQSASFASITKKMFNTYYAQDQLLKDQTTSNKPRRAETIDEGLHRDYLSTLQPFKDSRVENNNNSNRNAMHFMAYTTARKLNLNSKVTQFYTPTVPTFTTSTKTVMVGTVTEDPMVTTKATTIHRFNNGGVGGSEESQSFDTQFAHSLRREGIADEESIMDHAIEIMQTIKNLNIDESENHRSIMKKTIDDVKAHTSTVSDGTSARIDPRVKNSLGFLLHPPGIHQNVNGFKRMRIVSERNSNVDVGHRSLLTQTTLNEYDRLFQSNQNENNGNRIDDVHDHDVSEAEFYMDSQMEHDLEGQSSRYPILGMSNSTQIRELAQIFTHALSAYLQDPVTFRRILTEIRPKAPIMQPTNPKSIVMNKSEIGGMGRNFPISIETTTPSITNPIEYERLKGPENYEVLDFSDVTTTTSNSNSATDFETTLIDTSTMPTTTIDSNADSKKKKAKSDEMLRKQGKSLSIKFITNSRNELADEVNNELRAPASTSYIASTNLASLNDKKNNTLVMDSYITSQMNTSVPPNYRALPTAPIKIVTETISVPQSVLKPPVISNIRYPMEQRSKTKELLDDDEQLQRAQSEFILANQNNGPIYERNKYSVISLHNLKENSVSVETFNASNKTSNKTNITDQHNVSQQQTQGGIPSSRTTMSYTVFFDPLTINDELMELEKPTPTVAHVPGIYNNRQYESNKIHLNTDTAISDAPKKNISDQIMSENQRDDPIMQKKAIEMFGDLNDVQAEKIMSAIKMADKDKSMRRLILLLIRTCDDDPTSTGEESRKALLEALIKLGGVVGPQHTDELQILSAKQKHDTTNRRAKEIGFGQTTNFLYDELTDLTESQNITATTENYSNISSNYENNGGDSGSQDEGSEEWSKGSGTTDATTKIYNSPGESNLPKIATSKWVYGYDETNPPRYSTTPLPSTVFQTTVDSTSTVFTMITEPTVITTVAGSATSETSDYGSSTTIQTTPVDFFDTEYRSRESLESDSSSEMKPTFTVSKRLPKDLSNSLANPLSNNHKQLSPHNSDTRALELLKSLYSLAARWG
uniref:Chitin-binding type-2 domain-containing protein n=1 Tax=Anopheles gambiae TaxID=7165 RepID=A0A1S4H3K9_ANOGA|nr:uncharacterized protein LOC120957963 [Anopheles coluzzii]